MKNNMTNDMTNGNPVKLILLFSITSYISPSIRCSATSCPEGTRTTRRSKQSIIG